MLRDHVFDHYLFAAVSKAYYNTRSNPYYSEKRTDMLNMLVYSQNRALQEARSIGFERYTLELIYIGCGIGPSA